MVYSDRSAEKMDTRLLEEEIHFLQSRLNEKSQLEEQLRQAQKMEALANLASGIAHDFNNILQTILCYIQLSMIKSDNIDHNDIYIKIEKTIKKGSELSKQLIAFGRKNGHKLSVMNLNSKITEIRTILDRTIPKMIRIDLELNDNTYLIQADAGQIEQVLMNISINAKDAMPEGGVLTFRTENIHSANDAFLKGINANQGRYVRLTITDTGCGIREQDLQYIFDPFFTTKKKGEGTGLGLSMVYTIVRTHGGYIDVTSRFGQGTAFRIYFPSAKGERKKPNITEIRTRDSIACGDEALLLVDDEPTILDVWKESLQKFGYRVATATDGERAIDIFRNGRFDAVLLDVNMPGIGGLRCLEGLLRVNRKANVVISSGYSLNGLVKTALNMGAKAFLPKPYSIEHLVKTVRDILDTHQRAFDAGEPSASLPGHPYRGTVVMGAEAV